MWGFLPVGSHMSGNGDKVFFWIMTSSFPLETAASLQAHVFVTWRASIHVQKKDFLKSDAYLLSLLLSTHSSSNFTLCEVLNAKNSKFQEETSSLSCHLTCIVLQGNAAVPTHRLTTLTNNCSYFLNLNHVLPTVFEIISEVNWGRIYTL